GSLSADSYFAGPSRRIRNSFQIPMHIFPLSRKPTPPNIFFSENPLRRETRPRSRSASCASKDIGLLRGSQSQRHTGSGRRWWSRSVVNLHKSVLNLAARRAVTVRVAHFGEADNPLRIDNEGRRISGLRRGIPAQVVELREFIIRISHKPEIV